jgi:hypothetical protein
MEWIVNFNIHNLIIDPNNELEKLRTSPLKTEIIGYTAGKENTLTGKRGVLTLDVKSPRFIYGELFPEKYKRDWERSKGMIITINPTAYERLISQGRIGKPQIPTDIFDILIQWSAVGNVAYY